jgi:hypothetical protein
MLDKQDQLSGASSGGRNQSPPYILATGNFVGAGPSSKVSPGRMNKPSASTINEVDDEDESQVIGSHHIIK